MQEKRVEECLVQRRLRHDCRKGHVDGDVGGGGPEKLAAPGCAAQSSFGRVSYNRARAPAASVHQARKCRNGDP